MIVNVIEIFTEYLSVILCVHKIAKKRIKFDKYVWMFFLINLLSVVAAYYYKDECNWIRIIVWLNFYVYIKTRVADTWKQAIKIIGIMLLIIPSMQLIVYFGTKYIYESFFSAQASGVLVNSLICISLICWKNKYLYSIIKLIKKINNLVFLVVFLIFFTLLIYAYYKSELLSPLIIIQTLGGIIGLGMLLALWLSTEREKKHKDKEIQMYELYNKTFEDAITTIRVRQHEFDNHISAIKALQFTIKNPTDLIKAQNEYCDKVLRENSFNSLLKSHGEPILSGFLYSKLMNAKEQGIIISHEVHAIDFQRKIEINELVEIIGVFIDNAVEALLLETSIEKRLFIKILQEDENKVSIEVANRSRKFLNSEIEKFCLSGYSTKGNNRGMGLVRVKNIVKKYKAAFYIENINYNSENYLSFKVVFSLEK